MCGGVGGCGVGVGVMYVWCLSYLVGETPDQLCHPSCYHRSVRFIRMCLSRSVPLT